MDSSGDHNTRFDEADPSSELFYSKFAPPGLLISATESAKADRSQAKLYNIDINSNVNFGRQIRSKFNVGKCKICKDVASGIHYGVATCEGCKVIWPSTVILLFDKFQNS
jgi:hypothetical protein